MGKCPYLYGYMNLEIQGLLYVNQEMQQKMEKKTTKTYLMKKTD